MKHCKSDAPLVTTNDYADYFNVDNVPENFRYLYELAITTLNNFLLHNHIDECIVDTFYFKYVKYAILEQIKFINDNPVMFGSGEYDMASGNFTIGNFRLAQKPLSPYDKFSATSIGGISKKAYHYLDYIGWCYRGLC